MHMAVLLLHLHGHQLAICVALGLQIHNFLKQSFGLGV